MYVVGPSLETCVLASSSWSSDESRRRELEDPAIEILIELVINGSGIACYAWPRLSRHCAALGEAKEPITAKRCAFPWNEAGS